MLSTATHREEVNCCLTGSCGTVAGRHCLQQQMSNGCPAVCIFGDEPQQGLAHKVSGDILWHLHWHELRQTALAPKIATQLLAMECSPAENNVFAGLSAKCQIACCQSVGFQPPASKTAECCLEQRRSAAIPNPFVLAKQHQHSMMTRSPC